MPYYQDNHIRIFNKDCRHMDELPDESVQCVVTSPPYWGLRKYSGEQELIWGGDKDCEHEWDIPTSAILGFNTLFRPGGEISTPLGLPSDKGKYAETVKGGADRQQKKVVGNFCSLCGAWKGAYGLEPTPEMYIEHTIEILREIRRVLRKDGVVFWNIGDSYATHASGSKKTGHNFRSAEVAAEQGIGTIKRLYGKQIGLKEKDLCLIPFRVAIAAQEDGWWVRSVIIWSKPNPMPESVTDRPTESHEYILMLTKSGTTQYWIHRDHEGTRKQPKPDYRWVKRIRNIRGLKTKGLQELGGQEQHHGQDIDPQSQAIIEERNTAPEGWTPKNKMSWDRVNLWRGHDYYWDQEAVREPLQPDSFRETKRNKAGIKHEIMGYHEGLDLWTINPAGRNIRSVWEFPTKSYPEAHFAVFPEKLPEICIKAATPEGGCCSKCGAPWARVTKHHRPDDYDPSIVDERYAKEARKSSGHNGTNRPLSKMFKDSLGSRIDTIGWKPTCKCNASRIPSLVLDPMMGAGTTLLVAKNLSRYAVGYDLSLEYCRLALERNRQMVIASF